MSNFTLSHTVLYAKGWYKKYHPKRPVRKTIWDDLQVVLNADGYSTEHLTQSGKKIEINSILLTELGKIPKYGTIGTLSHFYVAVKENNCWQYSYFTKNNVYWNNLEKKDLPDYDYEEAVARYCLSFFRFLSKEQWDKKALKSPVLPIENCIKKASLTEIFD